MEKKLDHQKLRLATLTISRVLIQYFYMEKEPNIEKIIKRVQTESDARLEKTLKRHTGALLEEYQSRVTGIAEQYKDIKNTLDSHTKILESHTEEIGKLKVGVEEIRINVGENKKDIKEIRMDSIEIKRDVKEVKFWVVGELKDKVDKKHFVDLDSRVRHLEKKTP